MFEDNENEVIEAKEVKEEEKKEEKVDASNNSGTKYHLIRENFNKALMWAIIGLGIETVVGILLAIFGAMLDEKNVFNLIQCIIYGAGCAGLVLVGVVELTLFLNKTNPDRDKDIASFIISLVAFIIAFLSALGFGISSITNLIDFFRFL